MVSDPKVRLAESLRGGALDDNAGLTFSSVRDAAEVLFEGPAVGGVAVSDALRLAVIACDHSRAAGAEARAIRLSPRVVENLGLYVYALRDPRDRSIFYVGDGRGNKIYSHDWDALGEAGTLDSEAVGDPDRDEAGLRGSSGSEISKRPDIRWTTSCCGTGSRRLTMRRRKRARRSTSSPTPSAARTSFDPSGVTNLAGEPADLERRAMSLEEGRSSTPRAAGAGAAGSGRAGAGSRRGGSVAVRRGTCTRRRVAPGVRVPPHATWLICR